MDKKNSTFEQDIETFLRLQACNDPDVYYILGKVFGNLLKSREENLVPSGNGYDFEPDDELVRSVHSFAIFSINLILRHEEWKKIASLGKIIEAAEDNLFESLSEIDRMVETAKTSYLREYPETCWEQVEFFVDDALIPLADEHHIVELTTNAGLYRENIKSGSNILS